MIVQSNFDRMKNLAFFRDCRQFNCWGATLYLLGAKKRLYWAGENSMNRWLKKETLPVDRKNLQEGDIWVMRCELKGLIHTAVYLGNDEWFHKQGQDSAEVTTLKSIFDGYKDECFSPSMAETQLRRLIKAA